MTICPVPTRFRTLMLAVAAGAMFTTARVSSAETVRYPTDGPVFSFELPANWITNQKSPAVFQCVLKGSGGNIGMTVETLAQPCTNEEFATILPKVAAGSLEKMGGTEVEVGEAEESNGGMLCEVTAKIGGKPVVIRFFGFTPAPGKTFILQSFYPADTKAETNMAVAEKLLNSVKPL